MFDEYLLARYVALRVSVSLLVVVACSVAAALLIARYICPCDRQPANHLPPSASVLVEEPTR
jgi:hypothetical protein